MLPSSMRRKREESEAMVNENPKYGGDVISDVLLLVDLLELRRDHQSPTLTQVTH